MPEPWFQAIIGARGKKKAEAPILDLKPQSDLATAPHSTDAPRERRRADWSYIERSILAECNVVAACRHGQNDQLNQSAFAAQLVYSYDVYDKNHPVPNTGLADWAYTHLLRSAGGMANLEPSRPWARADIERTIRSGWGAGASVPHKGRQEIPWRRPPVQIWALLSPRRHHSRSYRPRPMLHSSCARRGGSCCDRCGVRLEFARDPSASARVRHLDHYALRCPDPAFRSRRCWQVARRSADGRLLSQRVRNFSVRRPTRGLL